MSLEEVLQGLRALSRPISTHEAYGRHRRLLEWTCRRFGTWVRPLNAAAFEYRPYQCRVAWSRERIVSVIPERRRAGKTPGPGVFEGKERGI